VIANLAGSPIYTLKLVNNETLVSVNDDVVRQIVHLPTSLLTDYYRLPPFTNGTLIPLKNYSSFC